MTRTPGALLAALRAEPPLVQCITNYVAMNIAANVLLAAGASPAMVSDAEEAEEFARFAGALTVNIGTLSPPFVDGMRAAIAGAEEAGRPWVFDPVACQATVYRRRVSAELAALRPTIIRGNASEILSLAGQASRGQGVDGRDPVAMAEDGARRLARKHQSVVAVTGAVDFVTNGTRSMRIEGGSPWMPMNTAMGCSLTCLCGAYAAVAGDPFDAAIGALAHFAVAGSRAHEGATGPGSFAPRFLDALHSVTPERLDAEAAIHADDTPVPVLDPGRGKTRQGRLWIYLRDERPHGSDMPPAALYRYSPDRKGLYPQTVLKDFTGHLHADGYAGFNKLYSTGNQPVREVACWAHVRRKIHDVYEKTGSKLAKDALDHIGQLFDIEQKIINKPPDDRLAVRQAHSLKQLDKTKTCFEHSLRRIPGKSDLAGAFRYALTRWDALTCYAYDGRCEISNNAAERAIRPLAIGRKNWLYSGSDAGGGRAAAIYSLIETAKMQELDPRKYLAVVLNRIADHPVNRIDELLPWNIDIQA